MWLAFFIFVISQRMVTRKYFVRGFGCDEAVSGRGRVVWRADKQLKRYTQTRRGGKERRRRREGRKEGKTGGGRKKKEIRPCFLLFCSNAR